MSRLDRRSMTNDALGQKGRFALRRMTWSPPAPSKRPFCYFCYFCGTLNQCQDPMGLCCATFGLLRCFAFYISYLIFHISARMSKEIGGFIATNQAEKSGMGRDRYDGGRNGYSHPARVVSLHLEIRNQYMSNFRCVLLI